MMRQNFVVLRLVSLFVLMAAGLLPISVSVVAGFAAPQVVARSHPRPPSLEIQSSKNNNREAEIARLEEELRRLKTEEKEQQQVVNSTTAVPSTETDTAFTTAPDTFLSERELLQITTTADDDTSNSSVVTRILASAAVCVGLVLFSQVPVGQEDLARYSATGSSIVKTIDLGDLNPDVVRRD